MERKAPILDWERNLNKINALGTLAYAMQCFLLQKTLCKEIFAMIRWFLWGSDANNRGICWKDWNMMCKSNKQGEMGLKELKAFNFALLAKQGWRLITNPSSLVAKVLQGKYYSNTSFLRANYQVGLPLYEEA